DGRSQEPVQVTLNTPHIDWFGLSPVLALIGTSFLALLCAVLVPRTVRRIAAASVSVVGFTAGIVLAVWLYVDSANGHTIVSAAKPPTRGRKTAAPPAPLAARSRRASSTSSSALSVPPPSSSARHSCTARRGRSPSTASRPRSAPWGSRATRSSWSGSR